MSANENASALGHPLGEEIDEELERAKEEHLNLDKRPQAVVNSYMFDQTFRTNRIFWIAFVILGSFVLMELVTWTAEMWNGLGITGLNRPTMWALYIVNFVYFIGVGHAGTFISAALRVMKFEFRRPISRAAEFVTIFALATAATFPIIHLGRSWKAYWLIPYPNVRQLWPNFHSPLVWDLMAITTYLLSSIIFAYTGLIPDLAAARDTSTGWRHRFYAILSLGWQGTERQWASQETALNVFSYVIIPVMFSVHTVVSWDFAMALQPGWHSTIFGPYFVIGALFSGAGAVIIALVLLRKFFHLEFFLRKEHLGGMGMFMLLLSLAWDYFYFNDYLVPWYGRDPGEKFIAALFSHGYAAPLWFLMLFSNVIIPPLLLFSKKGRQSVPRLFIASVFVQVGMYIERYLIVPAGLGVNELPYSWGRYVMHLPEFAITVGAFCLVGFLYIIAIKLLPIIPLWEVQEGQFLHSAKRIGKMWVQSKSEPD
jgi:Ni/Fe-hydrogenase subunit HybB-like protein